MSTSTEYNAFIDACNELINSKIILADAKVSKVLRSVLTDSTLLEIVGDALHNFNFYTELNNVAEVEPNGNNKIVLPNEPYRVIALAFSLLSEFDTRQIDLQDFVYRYYPDETLMDSYNRFKKELIMPFRDYLCGWVGYGTKDKGENTMSTNEDTGANDSNACGNDITDVFFSDLEVILSQIKEGVNMDGKIKKDRRDEINITIDALLRTIKISDIKILNALLISLNFLLEPIRSVRFYNNELKERVATFYSDLYKL